MAKAIEDCFLLKEMTVQAVMVGRCLRSGGFHSYHSGSYKTEILLSQFWRLEG